jgi:hypothetical protein
LKHKTRIDRELKFYKTMALPYLMDDSETWALGRDERGLEAAITRFLRCLGGYTCTLWDKEMSGEITSHIGMRKVDKNTRKEEKLAGTTTDLEWNY